MDICKWTYADDYHEPCEIRRLDPNIIRFTQDSCSKRFRNGSTVESLIISLQTGRTEVWDIPCIRVFRYSKQWLVYVYWVQ